MTKLHLISSHQELLDGTKWWLEEIQKSSINIKEKEKYIELYDYWKETLLSGKIAKSDEHEELRKTILWDYLHPIYKKCLECINLYPKNGGMIHVFGWYPLSWRFSHYDFWTCEQVIEGYEKSIEYWTEKSYKDLDILMKYRKTYGDDIYNDR